MECDSFETIVDYLKTTIPTMTEAQMEQTIAKVGIGIFIFQKYHNRDDKSEDWAMHPMPGIAHTLGI